jgi:hypothetical protein
LNFQNAKILELNTILNYLKSAALFALILGIFLAGQESYKVKQFAEKYTLEKKDGKANTAEHPFQASFDQAISLEAIVPFVQVDLIQDFFFLLSPTFSMISLPDAIPMKPVYRSKYFRILFLFVISPNAP